MYESTKHVMKDVHLVIPLTYRACFLSLSIMYHPRELSTLALDGSSNMSYQMQCVSKLRYNMHTQPPDISRSFTVAVFIHQNRFLYILHGRLNHFCGSSSHSSQPPRVNVKSTIRKEPGREAPTPSCPHIVTVLTAPTAQLSCSNRSGRMRGRECVCGPEWMYVCFCAYVHHGCVSVPTLTSVCSSAI